MNRLQYKFILFILVFGMMAGYYSYAQTGTQDPFSNFNLQTVPKIFAGLACYAVRFGMIAAFIAIVLSGIAILLSRGNATAYENGKKFLLYAIVGALVIYGVYTIILSVSLLVTGSTTLPWIPLSCP